VNDLSLLGLLNSRLSWFFLSAVTNIARGGYLRLRSDFVEQLPIPDALASFQHLAALAQTCTQDAKGRYKVEADVRHRILDLATPELRKLTGKLENFHALDFTGFREEVKKAFHADIPVKERRDWEVYIAENGAEVRRLTAEIEAAEREIDAIVYKLFDPSSEEIALLEASLAGQY